MASHPDSTADTDELVALRRIVEGTATHVGAEFFPALNGR
jgi:hypothetical protein